MTVEKYREARTKVHSSLDVCNYELVELDALHNGDRDGISLKNLIIVVDNLKIPYDKIYCEIDEVFWYTTPTVEYINERVEQDVQNFIAKEERNKKYNLKMYLDMHDKYGKLGKEEIEAILEG